MSLFDIALQCCDAIDYLGLGSECAQGDKCYGDLRPVGSYLWFSIPYRLGWPYKSLIAANFAFTALSMLLSVLALRKLLAATYNVSVGKMTLLILLLASSFIHAIFLLPTIFHTLTDPPSNMLMLSGIWLLVLAHYSTNNVAKTLQFFLVGLCFGLAVWLRAFYFYPAMAGVAIYMLLWVVSSKKKWVELLILLVLLPIGAQYFVMHREYGTYSFLEEKSTSSWTFNHLNTPYVGFDTVFPRTGYYWWPQHCQASFGILNGLQEKKYHDAACVLAERLYFYLGTYETETYKFTNVKNVLNGKFVENIGDENSQWFASAFDWQKDVEQAPNGEKTADKLVIKEPAPDGKGDVMQWVPLKGSTPYTFSVWLWSPLAKTINLSITHHYRPDVVALQQFTLSPEPVRYSITGITPADGLYDIDIGRTAYPESAMTFGTEAGDFFYAWGAQLEAGEKMTDYNGLEIADPDSVRVWHPALLALNVIVLLLSMKVFIDGKQFWLKSRAGISLLAILFVAAAECVAIIPEQRFAIGLMIFFWLMATIFVLGRSSHYFNKSSDFVGAKTNGFIS
jgi:hypothetical protein